ncbi:putative transcriptional regulator, LysR family [Arthrobacter sp. PAMC 25486]|uniref:LysR family transcriptional regulator n=1 Tax=Arthrobacter sp. PAMC 25486 TaxID=1494608 RepID=UPI000535E0D6|nr:LysR family transcriptional regulator [Arthrobacter sp. PAMC 25486]AIY01332.1 putative transcriptional regulator, LysR family [Arthrobacter sp. PAMC 25486]
MFFRQLEYLVSLSRERHFMRAAHACAVSQPALSEGLRKLEIELNVALIRRGNKFEGLTPEGEAAVVWARQILAGREGLIAEVGAVHGSITGTLRLGCIPTAANALSLLTGPFCAAHPGARVEVSSDLASSEVLRQVREHEIDGGLTYIQGPLPDDFRLVPLYRESYVLLSTNTGAVPPASWRAAATLPLCLLSPKMQGRQRIDALFAEAGVQPVPRLETDSVASLFAHVMTGSWATIVPAAWLHAFGVPPSLHATPLNDLEHSVPVGMVTLNQEPSPVLTRALEAVAAAADLAFLSEPPQHHPLL